MATNDKTILVTGATGQQGGAVARHLLEHGYRVLALTRDPAKRAARELATEGAELVRGNLDDPATYARALEGAHGVFSVQNPMESGIEGEVLQGTTLADAAKQNGVKHFVYTSVGGANMQTGIPFFDSKWVIEEHIREIGLPYTILRPVSFMENWWNYLRQPIMDGSIALPLDPGKSLQMIAVDDIGGFTALAFDQPETWQGREVELAGDEKTMLQVAEIFTRFLGRPVRYHPIDWDLFRQQQGEEMTKMYRWLNDVGYRVDIEVLRRVYPHWATLEQVLHTEPWRERMTA